MAFVTVIEASPLIGKSSQTIYRHIKQGKLSKSSNGKIDTSELIRVYGELRKPETPCTTQNEQPMLQVESDGDSAKWLKSQIEKLQDDIKQIKAESLERENQAIARENRLMALIEHKLDTTESAPAASAKSFLGKFFN